MIDVKQLLARQAEWQKRRRSMSWPEKIRMAEEIRESIMWLKAQPAVEPFRRQSKVRSVAGPAGLPPGARYGSG